MASQQKERISFNSVGLRTASFLILAYHGSNKSRLSNEGEFLLQNLRGIKDLLILARASSFVFKWNQITNVNLGRATGGKSLNVFQDFGPVNPARGS